MADSNRKIGGAGTMDCLLYSASHCFDLHWSDSDISSFDFSGQNGDGDYDCMDVPVLFYKINLDDRQLGNDCQK